MDENERKISPKSKSTNPAKQQRQPLLVKYQDRLFDITEFAPRHPGGEKLLRAVAGGEVDAQLGGEQHVRGQRHQHSKAAYEILARYSLDRQFKVFKFIKNFKKNWKLGKNRKKSENILKNIFKKKIEEILF